MTPIKPVSVRVYVALAILVVLLVVGGCGNSNTDTSTAPIVSQAPPPMAPKSVVPVPVPVTFEQLSLESKVTRKTDPNGLTFYVFSYADRDGRVYKCELPAAMAQGQKTPDTWTRVFDTHRLTQTSVKRKAVKDTNNDGLNDFPFIAPKPASTTTPQPGALPTGAPAPPQAPMAPAPSGPTPLPRG